MLGPLEENGGLVGLVGLCNIKRENKNFHKKDFLNI
jgi:hypothetical protein